jgi:hypothetical protein
MKRNLLSALALAASVLVLTGAERDERGGRGRGGVRVQAAPGGGVSRGAPGRSFTPGRAAAPTTIYRQQRVTVPRASMPSPARTIRDQNRAIVPQRNEAGQPITQRRSAVPPSQHAAVIRNTAVVNNIQRQQRVEVVPNRYYWHNDHGMRYSHYYDGRYHWYGFYHGPTFYWTRYYGDRWWWYDPLALRWVFWWDGFWWWPRPGGTPYVYVDNNYYPYEDSGVTVEHVQEQPAPSAMPEANAGSTTSSPDGRRMVQVFGEDGQAFLYDKTASPPTFMKYLGAGVSRVRFSGGTAAAPSKILVEYKDNTFALFDMDGNSESSEVKTEGATTPAPPEPPESIPPPPTAAPGQ